MQIVRISALCSPRYAVYDFIRILFFLAAVSLIERRYLSSQFEAT